MADLGWRTEHIPMFRNDSHYIGTGFRVRSICEHEITPERARVLIDHHEHNYVDGNDWRANANKWADVEELDTALGSDDPYRNAAAVKLPFETPEASRERVARIDEARAAGLDEHRGRYLIEDARQYPAAQLAGLLRQDPEAHFYTITERARKGHDEESVKTWGNKASSRYSRADLEATESGAKSIRSLVARDKEERPLGDLDKMGKAGINGPRYTEMNKMTDGSTEAIIAAHRHTGQNTEKWWRGMRGQITAPMARDIGRLDKAGIKSPEDLGQLTEGFERKSAPHIMDSGESLRVYADLASRKVPRERVVAMSRAGIPPKEWADVPLDEPDDKLWERGSDHRLVYDLTHEHEGQKWPWRSLEDPA